MQVKLIRSEKDPNYENRQCLEIQVDGKSRVEFRDGEPEDAKISRDFNGVLKIADLMREAHAAGARGEPFDVVSETGEW